MRRIFVGILHVTRKPTQVFGLFGTKVDLIHLKNIFKILLNF